MPPPLSSAVSFAPRAQAAAGAGGGIQPLRHKSAQQTSSFAAAFLAPVLRQIQNRVYLGQVWHTVDSVRPQLYLTAV